MSIPRKPARPPRRVSPKTRHLPPAKGFFRLLSIEGYTTGGLSWDHDPSCLSRPPKARRCDTHRDRLACGLDQEAPAPFIPPARSPEALPAHAVNLCYPPPSTGHKLGINWAPVAPVTGVIGFRCCGVTTFEGAALHCARPCVDTGSHHEHGGRVLLPALSHGAPARAAGAHYLADGTGDVDGSIPISTPPPPYPPPRHGTPPIHTAAGEVQH